MRILKPLLPAIFVGLILLSGGASPRSTKNSDQLAIGFPFEIKQQDTHVGPGKTTWWEVTLILPREHYSRENLERIFHYYSNKYPDKKSVLRVSVFADPKAYQRQRKTPICRLLLEPTKEEIARQKLPARDRWNTPHAVYERLCYNESYYYSLDLNDPEKSDLVVFSGKPQALTVIPPDCDQH